jgi:hypothetical protein
MQEFLPRISLRDFLKKHQGKLKITKIKNEARVNWIIDSIDQNDAVFSCSSVKMLNFYFFF